jgi:hypothetical protein
MFVRSLLAGVLLVPSLVAAQAPADTTASFLPERVRFSISANYGRATGELRDNVDDGFGLQGAMTIRLDQRGTIGLRVQAQYLNYGWENDRTCLGANPGCRVEANLVTANGIFSAGIGPELATHAGPVRLYGHALIGTSQFSTVSGLQGGWLGSLIATTENFGDGGFTWSSGIGATMPLALVGRTLIGIDVGVDYHAHGRRRYLVEGGITDLPDGSLELDIKESNASPMTFRVGVSFALLRRPKPAVAEAP